MKKMNLYFNVSRYFALLLPCFMLLGSLNVMADNGKNNPGKKTALIPTTKLSMVAIDATIASTPVVNCPAPNTTLGSVTVTVTGTPGFLAPTVVRVIIYNSALGIVGVNASAVPPVFPFVTTSGLILPAGNYTARVEVIDPVTNFLLEAKDFATTVGSGPVDAAAPVIAGPTSVTLAGCPGAVTAVTLANLGQTITDDCAGVNAGATTIVPANVPYNVATVVTITASDNSAPAKTSTKQVTVLVRDNIAPTVAVTVNGAAVACGGVVNLQTQPDALSAAITYSAAGADNCPGVGAVVQTGTLPATGTRLAIGTYTATFTVTDATGNTTTCNLTVNVTPVINCNEKATRIAALAGCEYELNYADLVGPGATLPTGNVTIRKPNVLLHSGTLPFKLASPFVQGGDELEVMFTIPGGQMCIAYFRLADLDAPVLNAAFGAIPVQTIRCNEIVNGKAPIPGAIVNGGTTRMAEPFSVDVSVGLFPRASLTNPIWTPTGAGASPARVRFGVQDCTNFYATYEDFVVASVPCNGDIIPTTIRRVWRFKDEFGNESSFVQTINVTRGTIVYPAVGNDCAATDAAISGLGLPFIDFNGNGTKQDNEPLATGSGVCGISVQLVSQVIMPTCPGSRMVMREWKEFNCGAFRTVPQNFNLNDVTPPNATLSYVDYARIPQQMCTNMVRELPDGRRDTLPMRSFVYTTSRTQESTTISGTGMIKITPLMRTNQCDFSDFEFTLTPSDPTCSNGKVTVSARNFSGITSSNVSLNGMLLDAQPAMSVDGGTVINVRGRAQNNLTRDNSFELVLTDPCGNVTVIKVIIVVIDNVGPSAQCTDRNLILNNAGEAFLNTLAFGVGGNIIITPDFSAGTFDNCAFGPIAPPSPNGIVWIRRKGQDCWSTELKFGCTPLGYDSVDIRVVDMMGNYTDCCIRVNVQDKSGPVCAMLPDLSVPCTDPRLQNLDNIFGSPVPTDNCGPLTVTPRAQTLSLVCGAGETTRIWDVRDNFGRSTVCQQRLVVTAVPGFRLTRLRSQNLVCAGTFNTIEQDRAAILSRIRNLDGSNRLTCAAPVVKITEMDRTTGSGHCREVMRTYEVSDLCFADVPCTAIPNVDANAANDLFEIGVPGSLGLASGEIQVTNGKICWSRIIRVTDNTPPVALVTPERVECADITTCRLGMPSITISATDNCGPVAVDPKWLFFRWRVRAGSVDGSILAENGAAGSNAATSTLTITPTSVTGAMRTALQNLSVGVYFLTWEVADDCGNVAYGTPVKITINDCKSPYINTHDKNTVLAYVTSSGGLGQGMSRVCVSEVLNALNDNCTDSATLLSKLRFVRASDNPTNTYPAANANGGCIMFTCADLANSPIKTQVWTVDNANNVIFNIVDITVQDNNRACSTPQSIVSGTLKTENNQAAKSVTMTATASGTVSNTATTDTDGAYTLAAGPVGGNFVLKASKSLTDDKYAGVTTFDIARISKHILDIENFTSPYQAIAADVNRDNVIDAIDMVTIRNFILRKTSSLPGGVWRFVDKSYTFRNPANPFGEDFPEVINLASAKSAETANFVAVKLGDVNATFTANVTPTVGRNAKSLVLNVEDKQLVAGNEYTVSVSADNFNAAAFQGTFSIANATIKSVKAGDLANYGDSNFALFADEFTTSWNGKAQATANVFTVTFVANKSGKLSDVMTVGSDLTPAVANDVQGNDMNVSLKFNTGAVKGGEFALHAATPNPMTSETNIGFVMPKDGAAKMTLYTVDGKVVLMKQIDAKAGLNNVTINKSELNASGVMYYRLETADNSATKKMVVIE
jgi:hypothetical protein